MIALFFALTGCATTGDADPPRETDPITLRASAHLTTQAIDRYDADLADLDNLSNSAERRQVRLNINRQRWQAVQRAVAYQGTTHNGTFYGSRAYWHTGSTRGLGWAIDHETDLVDPVFVDGRGNVRVLGDVNADIEITGDSIVHILGDLNSTLELKGVCEVVVAGKLTKNATIICDGQLELFVGGDSSAVLGATRSATIIIDGNAAGTIQCGAPATTLTITGDLSAQIPPPKDKDAVLTLRVDGFAPTSAMQKLASAGFTRVNATLGKSNAVPGLYPRDDNTSRPIARWVVLEQMTE